jgi:hypothetical protein
MNRAAPEELCSNAVLASHIVWLIVKSRTAAPDVLDAFWGLQDQLHRLTAFASDFPSETLRAVTSECRTLTQDIVELLSVVLSFKTSMP